MARDYLLLLRRGAARRGVPFSDLASLSQVIRSPSQFGLSRSSLSVFSGSSLSLYRSLIRLCPSTLPAPFPQLSRTTVDRRPSPPPDHEFGARKGKYEHEPRIVPNFLLENQRSTFALGSIGTLLTQMSYSNSFYKYAIRES